MREHEEQDQPQPAHEISRTIRVMIFIAGMMVLAGAMWAVAASGYQAGYQKPIDIGSPLGILAIILPFVLIFLLTRISFFWGKKPMEGTILAFFILGLVDLASLHSGAYAFGSAKSLSITSRVRNDLRWMGQKLEDYHEEHAVYPDTLESLQPDARHLKMRYAMRKGESTGSPGAWILWLPGRDAKDDLQGEPELRAALQELAHGRVCDWLIERTYDPTNGIMSSGDMVQYSGY